MTGLNLSFDFHSDVPPKLARPADAQQPPGKPPRTRRPGDPDDKSPSLRLTHQLLWTKELDSGVLFAPTAPSVRREGYLIDTDPSGTRHWYGSDAITASYSSWTAPPSLVEAVAGLDDEQRTQYLDPPYTIGSAMIWPVRKKDRDTVNRVRGRNRLIADRMDLTLECIRRHYAGDSAHPLAPATDAYADFFALFDGFREFVDFFHFQDLVLPNYDGVRFLLPFNDFARSGLPATVDECVTIREATLDFIERRGARMADWVEKNHPDVEVIR